MIKHEKSSIAQLNKEGQENILLRQQLAEQQALNELLKGCIMELANAVFGEGATTE